MELHLISPLHSKKLTVAWVEVVTPAGYFTIQRGHAPMVLSLMPDQPITFRLSSGKQESIIVRQGIIEITRELTTILMNEQL